MTFMEGAELAIVDPELRASARQAIGEFVGLVNEARTYGGDLRKVIEMIIDKSGLIGALQAENTDEARGRIETTQDTDRTSDRHPAQARSPPHAWRYRAQSHQT